MKEETAKKAAKWWADQLRGSAKIDNGDTSEKSFYALMLATILQSTEKSEQSPSSIDAFETALSKIIMANEYHGRVTLDVDYHPDHMLQEAATQSGLNLGMASLPWKTVMWINGDTIRVACGYGASPVEL